MKVGIPIAGFMDWGGGIDFLRIILKGLNAVQEKYNLQLVILVPEAKGLSLTDKIKLQIKKTINVLSNSNRFTTSIPKHDIQQIRNTLSKEAKFDFLSYANSKKDLIQTCNRENIEVLAPSYFNLGSSFPIPWVGYIPDFQHKYYPAFFSAKELKIREKIFLNYLSEAKTIVVNARAVKNDITKFYGDVKAEIFSLPFCPLYNSSEQLKGVDISKFKLPENYFLVSNQFWKHKDHATAFKALAEFIKQNNKEVHLVCTGSMSDYRFPDYINYLKQLIVDLGIENNLHLLGYILKEEQQEIMLRSKALIQPTLFEGGPGGGSVYEALALGVPVLMSDIPVNKEIDNPLAHFFIAGNESSLASKMLELLKVEHLDSSTFKEIQKNETQALGEMILAAIKQQLKND
jgi:glycosyltransferase involved in cell wall biosynthesis